MSAPTSRPWLPSAIALIALALATCFPTPGYQVERKRVTRETHDALFPINSGAHAGADCDVCHGDYDTFGHFSCINCHEHDQATTDPVHSGMTDYNYGPETCYGCHADGSALGRDEHDSYFPIAIGNHAAIGCRDCHLTDFASYDCVLCHTHTCAVIAPHHTEVANFVCDSPTCRSCHPQGEAGDDG